VRRQGEAPAGQPEPKIIDYQAGHSAHIIMEKNVVIGQFRGQKGLGPLEKPREMPHYMFCPRKIIISWTFKISGTLIVLMMPKYEMYQTWIDIQFIKAKLNWRSLEY
jgi:hypothetical protein